ncbi:MAG: hypothetical protein CBD39_02820 [Flavobacteriaceae bacterium TMED179]|nr:MAG: hypothetical protein CBD39_02820 [Flavobacteriaceae bacterium TMED179]|tara:strand:+ start:9463 stop:10281 length:819 start_codon:yes stop_codon:yes gene_type:complete
MDIINSIHTNLISRKKEFFGNKPFPYIILDDFLEKNYFQLLEKQISKNDYLKKGKTFNSDLELNKKISLNTDLPEIISNITNVLNSNDWLEVLKSLTDIQSLKSTKVGNTKLANYHEMGSDGFLGSHVDHSLDPDTGRPHVLNIILYLSSEWKEEFGGATLLFNKNGRKVKAQITYKKNRAVIFLHTPYSFHGVEKLNNNFEIKRKSLYVDYYSETLEPFNHINLDFPNNWFSHGTTFVLPKTSDYLKLKNWRYTKSLLMYNINRVKTSFIL